MENKASLLSSKEIARLRFRCRRGLLELDTLLGNFVDSKAFLQLNARERQHFERFLNEPDPQLLRWLMGQEKPQDPAYQDLIKKIRSILEAL